MASAWAATATGMFMSRIAPTAMLFIPCRGGVSHRADEYASPDDIAALFAFLASDDGAYMTGQVVTIDGGETAGGLASR